MYLLQFDNTELGKQRYEICTQAYLMTTKVPQLAEYDDVIGVLRKLKGIGRPIKVGSRELFDLVEDGIVTLERSELRSLLDYVKYPIWLPVVLAQVQEVIRWLEGLTETPIVELTK